MVDSPAPECPVCAGRIWSKDITASLILALPSEYAVYACEGCGQRRLDPPLSPDEIGDFYSDDYFGAPQGTCSALPSKAAMVDYAAVIAPERRRKFSITIRALKILHPSAKTVLDVGAAMGDFVRLARDQGMHAEGIELSSYAVKMARELNSIELDRLTLAELQKDAFYDVIHLSHVLEHFNDPVKELGHIHRLLAKGGLLYVEIPYQFHAVERLLFRLRRVRPEFTLNSLHHPYFYTPATISRLLVTNGFEVIKRSVFEPERYEAVTFRQQLKKMLWRILASVSIGNYIEVYARRA